MGRWDAGKSYVSGTDDGVYVQERLHGESLYTYSHIEDFGVGMVSVRIEHPIDPPAMVHVVVDGDWGELYANGKSTGHRLSWMGGWTRDGVEMD